MTTMEPIAAGLRTPAAPVRPARGEEELRACTQLLCRFAERHESAVFEELAQLAGPHLRRRAAFELARVGRVAEECEVVQETLLNIFRYAHTFQPTVPHAFATWSARIVHNVVLRFLRRRSRQTPVSLEDIGGGQDFAAHPHGDPHSQLEAEEERRELRRSFSLWLCLYLAAFAELTELQRDILHAVEIEGLRYRDIADRLGMRAEAVKMVVFRGRRRLMQLLERAVAA